MDPTGPQQPESPHHGYRGERPPPRPAGDGPEGLTIAISREAGARGSTIARRVGRKLGWQVYDREVLEYIANEASLRQELLDGLSPAGRRWVDARLEELLRAETLSQHPTVVQLVQTVLGLGVQGRAVLVGGGAGIVLPRETTLNVRVVAPLEDRIAYVAQWQRLTAEEAADKVKLRDGRRGEFLTTHFHGQPTDLYQYDLVLNSSRLGEDQCCDLIVLAARGRGEGAAAG